MTNIFPRRKTRHMLGENCPVATPTTEDSSMSLAEQSGAAIESAAPVQRESSVENQPSAESQQTSSPIQEEAEGGDSSTEDESGSDSDSGSSSESKSGPDALSESSPDLPSRETLPVIQGAHANQGQGSQKLRVVPSSKENQTKKKSIPTSTEKSERQGSQNKQPSKPLKSLRRFPCDVIFYRWYRVDDDNNIFRKILQILASKEMKDISTV